MPLGDIHASIELEDETRVYYGSAVPVTGHIVLVYKQRSSSRKDSHHDQTPLFGPLNIQLRFQGRLVTNADDRSGASSALRHNRTLFTKTVTIHDGSFQALPDDPRRFPFSISFPDRIQPRIAQRPEAYQTDDGNWRFNTSHHVEADCPLLPPSSHTEFAAKRLGERPYFSIEYVLDALVDLPGIEVKVIPEPKLTEVKYEQRRLSQPPLTGFSFFGANIAMIGSTPIPTASRQKGMRARARSFLQARDTTYHFQITCSQIPSEICHGQKISCNVKVCLADRPSPHDGDARLYMPTFKLDSFDLKIVQHTTLFAEDTGKAVASDVQIVQHLTALPQADITFTRSGDVHHISTSDTVHGALVPSTFSTQNAVRAYKLRLEIQATSMNQTRWARKDVPLIVHPPLDDDEDHDHQTSSSTYTEPSIARPTLMRLPSEDLPSYDDATIQQDMPPLDEYLERTALPDIASGNPARALAIRG